jgi:hypothetical protein
VRKRETFLGAAPLTSMMLENQKHEKETQQDHD